jgi:type IV pilus secretin PilQ/predicted competence protein
MVCFAGATIAEEVAVGAENDNSGESLIGCLLEARTTTHPGGGTSLYIVGEEKLTYDVFLLEDPYRVVIDLVGVPTPLAVSAPSGESIVRDLRYSLWKESPSEPIVRYVFETYEKPEYRVEVSGRQLTLWVEPENLLSREAGTKSQAPAPAEASPISSSAISEEAEGAFDPSWNVTAGTSETPEAASDSGDDLVGPFMWASSDPLGEPSRPLLVPMSEPASPEPLASQPTPSASTSEGAGEGTASTGFAKPVDPTGEGCPQVWGDAVLVALPDWEKVPLEETTGPGPWEPYLRVAEREVPDAGIAELSETETYAHAPEPETFVVEPETYEPELETYAAEPEAYTAVPDEPFETEPETFVAEPEAYTAVPDEPFETESEAFAAEPETYAAVPDEPFETEPETFAAEPETFAAEPETFATQAEPDAPIAVAEAGAGAFPGQEPPQPLTETPSPTGTTAALEEPEALDPEEQKLTRPDRFTDIIKRYQPAAAERAHRKWWTDISQSDPSPPLPGFDPDDPRGGAASTLPPMSLEVQGADIHTVLRSISEYSGVNIVADNNVKGALTMRALDLQWPNMLSTVCRSMGLVSIDHGDVIRIATERTAQDEAVSRESAARKQEDFMPLNTRIVRLRYANADELEAVVNTMRTSRGSVEVDERTNALVIKDIEPRLDQLEETLLALDTETLQIEITAEIVDIDVTEQNQLGISWILSNMHSSSANASGVGGVYADDVIFPAGDLQVGVIGSFAEVRAKIQALAIDNKADIISTPRITTVNNRMARILVGKEVPLITMDQAGNAITELKKVGIGLQVTPRVNSEELITLDLQPQVSDLSSQSTVQGGIVFTTTEADTRVMVRQGETAVIGGLIRTAVIKAERGVPLLKDIPLLGYFFRSTANLEEKRELLIFVTPRIVFNPNADR